MFRGSEGVDFPDTIYNPAEGMQDQKTNKHSFKNKRAQYYFQLRDRILRTHKAVNGEYHDPDTLISFDSSISKMTELRSELCRMPIKPNGSGLFELYTKQDMKSKFKFDSPNLADSVMMLMRQPHKAQAQVRLPQPLRPMGRR
jgi:phage terminase large subunit